MQLPESTIIVSLDSGWHRLFSGQLSRSKKVVGLILWPGAFQCGVYIIGMYPLGSRGFWANSDCLFKIRRVQLLRQRENGCLKLLPWVGTVHNDFVIGVGCVWGSHFCGHWCTVLNRSGEITGPRGHPVETSNFKNFWSVKWVCTVLKKKNLTYKWF